MAATRVAVVGAGLAGLSAALDLKDAGYRVDVFERTRLLGGRATSFTVAGREVDNGQHVFLGCCDAFIDFVRRAGMGDALHLQDRFDVVAFRGGRRARLRAAALPAPFHLAVPFMRYAHLSLGDRAGVARALLAVHGAKTFDGSFAAWLAHERQSASAVAGFWEPFVVPALNAPLDVVPARDAAFVLDTAFLHDAGAARFGWSTVPLAHVAAAVAERVDAVHVATGVAAVHGAADGVTLELLAGDRRTFDRVVLAVPPPQLARMLGDPANYGLAGLDAYDPWPIVDAHLWYEGPDVDFAFATLLDSPVQWVFRKDTGYLCCSISAAGEMLTAPTDDVLARCWREVQSGIPALAAARMTNGAVTRNPNATYLPRAGTTRPGSVTNDARIVIAGSWCDTGWPDTMESAVRSGSAAAAALIGSRAA